MSPTFSLEEVEHLKSLGMWKGVEPEPTYTLAQVKEIIKGIAVRVENEVKRCEAIEEARYSEEYAQSRLTIFNDGHIGGLTTALAIIEKAGGE